MKKLSITVLAAAGIALGATSMPVAQASCCEDEFSWADPYVDAFQAHGVGYLVQEIGIPLINDASLFCTGQVTRRSMQEDYNLTDAETVSVVEAAQSVCG